MTTNTSELQGNSGRRILPKQSVTVLSEPILIGNTKSHAEGVDVNLVRDGNKIREIHVQCPCGQTLVLECEYATDAETE